MSDWKKVYECKQEYRAEIVKTFLDDHGIVSIIINKLVTPYNMIGHFEVVVEPDDVIRSIKLIEENIHFE